MKDIHIEGLPCSKCKTTLRYKKRPKVCVHCQRSRYTPKLRRNSELVGTYYERNKERQKTTAKAWQKRNPEKVLFLGAKHRAKRTGREFTITINDIVIPEICPVFNTPMVAPSIDRKDNSKGYTPDNIRVISKKANLIKKDATIEELEAVLRYMKS